MAPTGSGLPAIPPALKLRHSPGGCEALLVLLFEVARLGSSWVDVDRNSFPGVERDASGRGRSDVRQSTRLQSIEHLAFSASKRKSLKLKATQKQACERHVQKPSKPHSHTVPHTQFSTSPKKSPQPFHQPTCTMRRSIWHFRQASTYHETSKPREHFGDPNNGSKNSGRGLPT